MLTSMLLLTFANIVGKSYDSVYKNTAESMNVAMLIMPSIISSMGEYVYSVWLSAKQLFNI